MSVTYPECQSDRECINKIKKDRNQFRNKIIALIEDDNSPFRSWIGELHIALENSLLDNQDRRITFTNVRLGKNSTNQWKYNYRGLSFFIQYGSSGTNDTIVKVLLENRKGNPIVNIQQEDYNISNLQNHADFRNIRFEYQSLILDGYRSLSPYTETNLLVVNGNTESYQCGSCKFIKDAEKIAQGLIEIVYNMRNSLFHGELIPSKDVCETYGVAYRILRKLIDAI